jgi:hypothetical protein
LPAGGFRSPAQKVYILHKKLSLNETLCAKPLAGENEPSFSGSNEPLAMPVVAFGLCQFLFGTCSAFGR